VANYTSSTAADDHLPLVSGMKETIVCACCGETMKHFRTIAELGVRPEKYIFVCPFCKGVDYKEPRKAA
jgi:hypothetical protein